MPEKPLNRPVDIIDLISTLGKTQEKLVLIVRNINDEIRSLKMELKLIKSMMSQDRSS